MELRAIRKPPHVVLGRGLLLGDMLMRFEPGGSQRLGRGHGDQGHEVLIVMAMRGSVPERVNVSGTVHFGTGKSVTGQLLIPFGAPEIEARSYNAAAEG